MFILLSIVLRFSILTTFVSYLVHIYNKHVVAAVQILW